MRRLWIAWILLPLLAIPVQAKEGRRYAAFVVDSGPSGKYTLTLLDGLYDRGIHATFLMQGRKMSDAPDILQRILDEGHEAACRGFSGETMIGMSRRDVAAEILDFQALLPEGYPLKLFCPPGGCNDAVRQVAVARKLALLSWSADTDTPAEDIQDGDLILLRDHTSQSVETALALADALLEADFELVTVARLASLRRISIRPGQTYQSFPPPETEAAG